MIGSALPQENIAAAQAVTALREVSLIDAIKPLLGSEDGRVRAAAMHAYAGLGLSLARDCAEEVAAALSDSLESVRLAAVKRLPAVQSQALRLSLLAEALEDPAPGVRRAARSLARELLPESAEALAAAFAEHFHRFAMQTLLAAASRKLEPAARESLLGEIITRHLQAARQKRQAGAQLKGAGLSSAVAQVLQQALEEEAQRHLGAAIDLLAEKNPCEALHQAAGALHSQDAGIRAQGLESLQCLGDNELSRGIAELVDPSAPKPHGQDMKTGETRQVLASLAQQATPWLRECIEAFLGKGEENGRPGYAV
jgi:hypothetical protein